MVNLFYSTFSGLIEDKEDRMYIEPYPAKVIRKFIFCFWNTDTEARLNL